MNASHANATVLRFNTIAPALTHRQGQWPETRLKRKVTALLHGLAKPCCNLIAAGVLHWQTRLPESNPQQAIDNHSKRRQYKPTVLNRTASREKLEHNGRQSALNSFLSGIFTSAYPLVLPFAMAGRGKVRPSRAGSLCQFLTPCPLPAAHRVRTGSGTPAITKGHTMTTRKAFSRPIIAHPLRTFPNLIQASAFVDRLTASNTAGYRFNIQQHGNAWTVARVVSGGAV